MTRIATYVFLDLETTSLPKLENNKTRITELSMVAVKRDHILDTTANDTPRVKHKLTLCFNPGKMIWPESTQITLLSNELLEHESNFNTEAFNTIDSFIKRLQKPVCLVAHNGNVFDFPILKNHFEKLNARLSDDIMCADTLLGFQDILEGNKDTMKSFIPGISKGTAEITLLNTESINNGATSSEMLKLSSDQDDVDKQLLMKSCNETTPVKFKPKIMHSKNSKVRKRMPWDTDSDKLKCKDSYKLEDIYRRLLGCPTNGHQAEGDCLMMLEISVLLNHKFVEWVDVNCIPFSKVKAMTLGISIGR